MGWLQELEVEGAEIALEYVEANATELEKELDPYIKQGEEDVLAAAEKVSPLLGAAVKIAINYLASDVPKYEGDAVKWIEATLSAFIAKVKQTP